jgi:hypothetical protein
LGLYHLNQLSLAPYIDSAYENTREYPLPPDLLAYISSDCCSLQELTILSTQLKKLPKEAFSRLTRLVVRGSGWDIEACMYLCYGHRLETLELHNIWSTQLNELLNGSPSTFPVLQRLCLTIQQDHVNEYYF